MTGEFDLIARHFAPLAGPEGLGLKDDAAVLVPPPDSEIVLTVDANVAGVHFLADEAPDVAARRLLRANLSDLAAKGARPLGYLLSLVLPDDADDAWVAAFARGLGADQARYDVKLFGGDTVVAGGPAVASITAVGHAPRGRMLKRSGARPGDAVYVTGTIGDAAFGLEVARGGHMAVGAAHRAFLEGRYRLPEPPVAFGPALADAGLASAAADVSDGLIADAGHIATASGVAIEIEARAVPLSPAAQAVIDAQPESLSDGLTGGDDFQIVFCGRDVDAAALIELAAAAGTTVARVGRVLTADGRPHVVAVDADGQPLELVRLGYVHR